MDSDHRTRSKKSWILPAGLLTITVLVIIAGILFKDQLLTDGLPPGTPAPTELQATPSDVPSPDPAMSPDPNASPSPGISLVPASNATPDLTMDPQGLSKTTALMRTDKGMIKFKFYPADAPNTVDRIIALINQGFYNGLSFHRVVPGFVIQGGDPTGTGAGGSGQKLKAEFNNRKHIEGALAMARAADPDSADSQFYISLGMHPHLDRNYTAFGQVISGMDIAKKIAVGDRIISLTLE